MKTVGVDVGGTKILCRLVDPKTGKAKGRVKAPTPKAGPDSVLDKIVECVDKLDPDREAEAIGVGFPGVVHPNGTVVACANVVGWDSPVDVVDRLEDRLERRVVVGNDVSLGALGEHRYGAGRGYKNLLAVFVGTGVGGGIVLNNKLHIGETGLAGEIGHLTVEVGGRVCACGGLGHLEAYAGKAGLEAQLRELAEAGQVSGLFERIQDGSLKSKQLGEAIEAGDPVAVALIAQAADRLAFAVSSLATALDIKRVVFGGGVASRLGEPYLAQIRQSASFTTFGGGEIELVLAQRIDDAVALGAGVFAADELDLY